MNYILIIVGVVLAVGSIVFIYFLSSENEGEKEESLKYEKHNIPFNDLKYSNQNTYYNDKLFSGTALYGFEKD